MALRSGELRWRPLQSVGIAASATAVAIGLMFWSRAAFQIRALPERVMEWVLLFVPPDAFEAGIGRFGPQAKVYALYVAVAGMALILVALGMVVLRLVRPVWGIWAVAPALYLFAMGVVMPVTGAGFFATELIQDPLLVNACYAAIALTYAAVLLLGGLWMRRPTPAASAAGQAGAVVPPSPMPVRRALLAATLPAFASYLVVAWLSQRGGRPGSDIPLATIPNPTGASPAVDPTMSAAAMNASRPSSAPVETPPPTPGAEPPMEMPPATAPTLGAALPVPKPLTKQLTRDKDGSLTAGSRQPGTLSELITPTQAHYHVTKNPVADPVIAPDSWRLVLDGEFQRPVQLDYRTLRALPAVEIVKTLECISNLTTMCELVPFGCELIGTARWKGVPLRDLIEHAGGFKSGVASVQLIGADEFSSVIPPEVALDPETVVAYEMNGDVLPYEHGYPARVLAPNRYGFKSAKWIVAIRPATHEVRDWYSQRNWNADGIVKTMTRIDVPAPGATLSSGDKTIAGIAYAGTRGVAKVEFSADGGQTWQEARLREPQAGADAWVRWEGTFRVSPRTQLTLVARATEGTGELQVEGFSLAQPDGASGWNGITVSGS